MIKTLGLRRQSSLALAPLSAPPAPPAAPWRIRLSGDQLDRAAGVLLGAACGDALGVPYEFGVTLRANQKPQMIGGGLGPYQPGEYSDDTQMAVCIALVAATGADLRSPEALDLIATGFLDWCFHGASDIGAHTGAVLHAARKIRTRRAAALRTASTDQHTRTGRSGGNGSLMRTAVVALSRLEDPVATAEAAWEISGLTHADRRAGEACILWCEGIRQAVLNGTLAGVRAGIELLAADSRPYWSGVLDAAERGAPANFNPNGYVVPALQAAWLAVVTAETTGADASPTVALTTGVEAAVRAGHDTDTVAAIAGALLGARWGASAVPIDWRISVHGWPGLTERDLVRLAVATALRGEA